jgi:hypothetical protein
MIYAFATMMRLTKSTALALSAGSTTLVRKTGGKASIVYSWMTVNERFA